MKTSLFGQAMVDEIIAKIMEEEKQEALAKMAKRKETIEYVRSYLEDNERLKEEEKRRQEHEDEEILRSATARNSHATTRNHIPETLTFGYQ